MTSQGSLGGRPVEIPDLNGTGMTSSQGILEIAIAILIEFEHVVRASCGATWCLLFEPLLMFANFALWHVTGALSFHPCLHGSTSECWLDSRIVRVAKARSTASQDSISSLPGEALRGLSMIPCIVPFCPRHVM